MTNTIPARLLSTFLAVASLATLGCGNHAAPPVLKQEPLEVSVANPLRQTVNKSDDYLATLDAAETVKLQARVTGYLTEIKFTAGKTVKKGEILFVLDKRPFEVDLKKAQGDVKSALATLSYSKKEVARLAKGLSNGSVSREDYDKSEASVAVAEASVEVANASIDRAKLNLEFCEVKSPIEGIVSRETVTIGNLIQADNTTLTTIVSRDPVNAYFEIDQRAVQEYLKVTEKKRIKITEGELYPVSLALDTDTGFPHNGGINFAENRLNPETGALRIRGIFYQKDAKRELLPGYTARVRVPGPEPFPAVVVPDRIVGTDQDRKFVYVVNTENKVEYRVVKLGILANVLGYPVRVIAEGLEPSDRVIVNGMQSVRRGVVVVPKLVNLLTDLPLEEPTAKK